MARPTYPSDNIDKLLLRFPDGMRDRISDAAKANNRSMNSEIISRLQASFDQPGPGPDNTNTIYIAIDPEGHPISWPEVHAHIGAVCKAGKFDPDIIQAIVLTKEMTSSTKREDQWLDLVDWYKETLKKKR